MTRRIKAKYLKEGQTIVYVMHTLYVDSVEWTRAGQIKANVGFMGTGTEWFDPDDILFVED